MVQILIPTYFGGKLVTQCLASVFAQVKNPDVRVFQNDIGFVQACNKMMRETNDDVLLLNDDTVVLSDIVEIMHTLAYSDPKIGIVGGKSLSKDGIVINYGIDLATDGNTGHRYFGWRDEEVDFVANQKAVEGSCMYIRREVLDTIGYFDEGYGLGYREELDFALRAREAGYKIVSSPDARYIHFISQTNMRLGITNDTYDYFMSKWREKLALGIV